MKYSATEINKFAEECAKINSELWDVIGDCETLLSMPIAKDLQNSLEEQNTELIKSIYNRFSEVTADEDAIDADLHSATLSDASNVISLIVEQGK